MKTPPPTDQAMLNELYELFASPEGDTPRFRFGYYNLRLALQFVLLMSATFGLLIWIGSPSIIRTNTAPEIGPLLATLVVALILLCFAEHALHRNLMHNGHQFGRLSGPTWLLWLPNQVIRLVNLWSTAMRESHHETHHHLTSVKLVRQGAPAINNGMPIDTIAKTASATFPRSVLFIVSIITAPVVIAIQLIWPTLPIILASCLAITWQVGLYENAHALFHRSDEWWRRACRQPVIGGLFLWIKGIHFVHHIHHGRNLAVAGFLLVPLADMVRGSYRSLPEVMQAWLNKSQGPELSSILERAIVSLRQERTWFCLPTATR